MTFAKDLLEHIGLEYKEEGGLHQSAEQKVCRGDSAVKTSCIVTNLARGKYKNRFATAKFFDTPLELERIRRGRQRAMKMIVEDKILSCDLKRVSITTLCRPIRRVRD